MSNSKKIYTKFVFKNRQKKPISAFLAFVPVFFVSLALTAFGNVVPTKNSPEKTVIIVDNGLEINIQTNQSTVRDILQEMNLNLDKEDLVFPNLDTEINHNYRVFIYRKQSPSPLDLITEYSVEGGDTVISIAQKFGVSSDTVRGANNINNPDIISPGQKLLILPVTGVLYTVAKDETLSSIAKKYLGDEQKILDYNKILNPTDLEVGQKIIIPDGKYPEPKKEEPKKKAETLVPVQSNEQSKSFSQSDNAVFGLASWYSWRTGYGCACLKYPLGTRIKVTNLSNSASVIVVVNDRGPYIKSRIVDLTKEAFSQIANPSTGVVKVKVEPL